MRENMENLPSDEKKMKILFFCIGTNSPAGESRSEDDARILNYEPKKTDGNNFFMVFLRDRGDSLLTLSYKISHDYKVWSMPVETVLYSVYRLHIN